MIQVSGFYPALLPPKDTLQNTSWANIAKVAAAGLASTYWAVGDTKTITFGSAVLGSTTITVKIMGFDYDDLASGGKAPITFGMVDCFANTLAMNSTRTNVGGWGSCALRTTLMNTVLVFLEASIGQGIIKPVSKRTSAGNKSSTINITTDSAWLMSEYEIFGAITKSFAGEKPTDKSICYPAFTNAASRIKKVDAIAQYWWERSPVSTTPTTFGVADSVGAANDAYAEGVGGVAIGFCV